MDHLIPDRRPNLVLIIKKYITVSSCGFTVSADDRRKVKKVEKLDFARE